MKHRGKAKRGEKGKGKGSSRAKTFKIKRFKAPFSFTCGKCEEGVVRGVEFDAIKESVGNYCGSEIWSYTIKCPSCGNKIVMDKHPKDQRYKVYEGVQSSFEWEQDFEGVQNLEDFDWKAWKEKRSKEILEEIAPGSSQKYQYNIFDVYGTCFVQGDTEW